MRDGVISYGLSSYGYDIRVADEFKIFTNINSTVVDPKNFDRAVVRRRQGRRLHHPAQLVRARAHRRVLPDSAERADDLRRQVHVRALRHHHQRDAVRARMGGLRHARDLEHDAAAGAGSTRTRASPRCSSSRATSRARCRTPTRRASTRSSRASPCRGSDRSLNAFAFPAGPKGPALRRSAPAGPKGPALLRPAPPRSPYNFLPDMLRSFRSVCLDSRLDCREECTDL